MSAATLLSMFVMAIVPLASCAGSDFLLVSTMSAATLLSMFVMAIVPLASCAGSDGTHIDIYRLIWSLMTCNCHRCLPTPSHPTLTDMTHNYPWLAVRTNSTSFFLVSVILNTLGAGLLMRHHYFSSGHGFSLPVMRLFPLSHKKGCCHYHCTVFSSVVVLLSLLVPL
ncbi:hypothetical protein K435DRAFT_811121 [Dendrothele bispora CBS 962.96]|uniref:Uncharacterized protein n=1 Tax=Dendrothele bispora (strain CBS 962.96) TaxID=1314807 RepID=A0A4S8KSZ4_DENBC|nr:hypothetical protein K435DRAFT_811121 [Dendrothele bispora CBS 962.96]